MEKRSLRSWRKSIFWGTMALCLVWAGLAWGATAGGTAPAAGDPAAAASAGPAPADPVAGVEKILSESAQDLERVHSLLKERLASQKEALAALKKGTNELDPAASAHKASLALNKMPLPKAADLLREYSQSREKIGERLKAIEQDINNSSQARERALQARGEFETQVERLKKMELPPETRRALSARYQSYQEKGAAVSELGAQLLKVLQEEQAQARKQQELTVDLVSALGAYIDKNAKRQLFSRQQTAALRAPLGKVMGELAGIPAAAVSRVKSGAAAVDWRKFLESNQASLLGLLALGVLLLLGARRGGRALRGWLEQRGETATYFTQKILLALGGSIVHNAWLWLGLGWLALGLWVLNLIGNVPGQVVLYGLVYLGAYRLGSDLIGAMLPPRGIVVVDAATARFYKRYLRLFLAYLLAVQWGTDALEWLQYPSDVIIFLGFISLLGILLWFVWLLRKPVLDNLLEGAGLAPESWGAMLMRGLRLVMAPLLGVIIVADLLGFHILALYVSSGTSNTVLAALSFWFLGHMGKDLGAYFTHPDEGLLARKLDLEAERLARPHYVLPKLINTAILILVVLGVLLLWGVPWDYFRRLFRLLSQGPDLGPVKLTPVALVLAVASIYLARWLSSLSRFALERRLYNRVVWNVAVQTTISTAINYGLMTVGIVLALGFLGVNLTNLALIAGALGVGIGFGLQNIVNNFVSGLIILFERPIKVGDLLIIDGQWGEVKAIRVRSTVFETRDHCVLIIPNSELLSSKIQNWTHFGRNPFRLTLKTGVAYGSDVEEVAGIIRRVCRENRRVLAKPAPEIIFHTFGDSALEFTVRVHLQGPDDRDRATHELNTAIYRALGEAGIEIPFPQRECHIKTLPEGLAPRAKAAGPEEK